MHAALPLPAAQHPQPPPRCYATRDDDGARDDDQKHACIAAATMKIKKKVEPNV